jgi:hypothetical protein
MADNVPTISAFRLAKSALKLNHAIINTFAVPVGLADGSQVRISGSKFNVTNAAAVVTKSSLNDIRESEFTGSADGDVLDITGQISLLRLKFAAKDALGANLARVCRECSFGDEEVKRRPSGFRISPLLCINVASIVIIIGVMYLRRPGIIGWAVRRWFRKGKRRLIE